MNTEVIITVVLVIVVLAVIAYFVYKKDKYAPMNTPPQSENSFITIYSDPPEESLSIATLKKQFPKLSF
jgi:hypothetical protein